MSGVTVVPDGGRLLAVKRGEAARLRNEADALRLLDHPGLVSFVTFTETEPAELHTVFAGPDNWLRHPPDGERAAVAGLAAVAATVADLHDVGATHGAISAGHVVTAADGRPLLCSLAASAPADDAGRTADLAGLGDLVGHCCERLDGPLVRPLRQLAARCHDSTLDARALARELDALEPSGSRPRGISPRARVIAVAASVAVAAVTLGWFTSRDAPAEPAAPTPTPTTTLPPSTTAPPVTTRTPSTTTTTTTAPSTTTTTLRPPTTTSAGGATTRSSAPELIHDGRRYHVGRAGDLVVVGDWNCDGIDTPALLRPNASIVAVFDAWPPPDGTLEPAHVSVISGTALDRDTHDECDLLRVRTAAGSELVVLPSTP